MHNNFDTLKWYEKTTQTIETVGAAGNSVDEFKTYTARVLTNFKNAAGNRIGFKIIVEDAYGRGFRTCVVRMVSTGVSSWSQTGAHTYSAPGLATLEAAKADGLRRVKASIRRLEKR